MQTYATHFYCTKGYFIRERRNAVSFNVVSLFLFSLLFACHASTIVVTTITVYYYVNNGGKKGSEDASASKNPSVSPCLRLLFLMCISLKEFIGWSMGIKTSH